MCYLIAILEYIYIMIENNYKCNLEKIRSRIKTKNIILGLIGITNRCLDLMILNTTQNKLCKSNWEQVLNLRRIS